MQQALSDGFLTGRLAFDTLEDYAAYADKVVAWHKNPTGRQRACVVLHTVHDGTQATRTGHLGLIERQSAPLLAVNGKLDDQAPVEDIYLLMEHGNPKEARIFPRGGHMGRTPGMDASVITRVIADWLQLRLGA